MHPFSASIPYVIRPIKPNLFQRLKPYWRYDLEDETNRVFSLMLSGTVDVSAKSTNLFRRWFPRLTEFFAGSHDGVLTVENQFRSIQEYSEATSHNIRFGAVFNAKSIVDKYGHRNDCVSGEVNKVIDSAVAAHNKYVASLGYRQKVSMNVEDQPDIYYVTKSLSSDMILDPIPTIIDQNYSDYVRELMPRVRKFVDENQIVERSESKITKTGWTAKQMGIPIIEYEYCVKSPLNAITAIFTRQTSCRLTPQPSHLKKFDDM